MVPLVGYFAGAATSVAVFGRSVFASRTLRILDLRRGFILEGGKASLRPFNRMLWTVWGLFGFPTVLIAATVVTASALSNLERGEGIQVFSLVPPLLLMMAFLSAVFIPQLFMNRLLSREKAEEVSALRMELAEAADLPDAAGTDEILRRMHRHQHVTLQLGKAEAVVPTLIDARFVVQITVSVTAIFLANVLLRVTLA